MMVRPFPSLAAFLSIVFLMLSTVSAVSVKDIERWEKTGNIEPLREALKSRNKFVRKKAVEALGRIGDPISAPYLVEALEDGEQSVRRSAKDAMTTPGLSAVPYLEKVLIDDHYEKRRLAAEALSVIGDP